MKLIGLIMALALALVSCSKENVSQNEEQANGGPATTPAATVAGSPKSLELAPEGVFYLIVAARVQTREGIRGLPVGTGVKRVRPGIYLTPAGEVPLDPSQLTNDLGVARAARDAAVATQAALAQRAAADAARVAAAVAVTPKPAATIRNTATAAPTPTDVRFNGMPLPGSKHIPSAVTQTTGLQSSTALGASHSKVEDGVVWQRSPDGQWWVPVKYTNGRVDGLPHPRRAK